MSKPNKTALAKLLATENITVQQQNVRTASFDVKNRVLTLPIWATEDVHVADHMTGHEVGHALYTPLEGWHDAVCSKGPAFKSYLNVVEDARIEKLIQRKYPGLRSSFIKSYRKLLADGFFGADIETINDMGLIDRINTYFKCGVSSGVRFAPEERVWIDRIDTAETWEQVVQITEELFASEKQKAEEQDQDQEQEQEDDQNDDGDESDTEGSNSSGESDDQEDLSEEYDEDESDNFGQGDTSDEFDDLFNEDDQEEYSQGDDGGRDVESQIASQTDENLRNAMDDMVEAVDDGTEYYTLRLIKENTDHRVIDNKKLQSIIASPNVDQWFGVLDSAPEHRESGKELAANLYSRWYRENKKSVQTMVKEFEMRKSASEYQRTRLSRSGSLDTVKMNNYKITEDIFRKVSVVPEGKNHGFIMMLDMSGSMHDQFYAVAQHTILMAAFCRQINVPFRVYGFIDYTRLDNAQDQDKPRNPFDLKMCDVSRLLELFNEKMSKTQFASVAGELMLFGESLSMHRFRNVTVNTRMTREEAQRFHGGMVSTIFGLGGTPLDSCIIALIPQALEFRKQHRLDKLHTIFLTDGSSHTAMYESPRSTPERRSQFQVNWFNPRYGLKKVSVINEYNNQTYKFSRTHNAETECFLEMYKDAVGSDNMGYFVYSGKGATNGVNAASRFSGVRYSYEHARSLRSKFNRGEHVEVKAAGYDTMYIVGSKSFQRNESAMDEVGSGSSKAKLRSAFKKSGRSNAANRSMLISIVKAVA